MPSVHQEKCLIPATTQTTSTHTLESRKCAPQADCLTTSYRSTSEVMETPEPVIGGDWILDKNTSSQQFVIMVAALESMQPNKEFQSTFSIPNLNQ